MLVSNTAVNNFDKLKNTPIYKVIQDCLEAQGILHTFVNGVPVRMRRPILSPIAAATYYELKAYVWCD
jgi:hypothetical protein